MELPDVVTIKDKRSIVQSAKRKLQSKFKVSCAETDLLESLRFAQIGAAFVSNSAEFGEKVLQKALRLIEDDFPLRIHSSEIHSERFD
jgi:uncharacterized protein YlxP (DUF503 family)